MSDSARQATPEPSPSPSPSARRLRVVVDLNRCQAYAQCCYAAPEHFVIEGREALFYDPAPPAEARADLERARIACPVQAIRVEDPGQGEL
ncbi:ferredoxin [Methylobacterium nigriterrae]|uniref:ferredoxin n=1 Tax=Methylobacterium nigriterrae TaxID=3127512 RepID=UPI003D669AA3